jgi:predicted O-linked N-acetylglucosamine transferase (SPINDLY family)
VSAVLAGGDKGGPGSRIEAARRSLEAGRFAEVQALCRAAVEAEPGDAEAWTLLGIAACRQGDPRAGAAALRRALTLEGGRADIHMNLGNALRESGEAKQAEESCRAALRLAPGYALAHYNLGLALEEQGRDEEALASYGEALRRDDKMALALLNSGGILEGMGRKSEAMQAYMAAIRRDARLVDAYRNIAALLEAEGNLAEAIPWCQQALKLEPENPRTLYLLGLLLEQHGSTDHAAMAMRRAIERMPPAQSGEMRLAHALLLPPVARSREHIGELRARYARNLDELAAAGLRLAADGVTLTPPFYLAYHGECNRELHAKLAATLLEAWPALGWTAPHCRRWRAPGARIRVGFLSRFLRNHSIGRTTRGLVAELDRARFEVTAIFLPPAPDDEIARFIRERAERSVTLPTTLYEAREAIAALELDVLFYQDIGMETMSWLLAFARLAPVQCLSFGHPDTTGIPNMDWFVSGDLYEPEGAEASYSERLFLLRNLGTLAYYYRPRLQEPAKSRAQLGLPQGNVYLCPQTLFKLHPDFDALAAGILRADPAGRVVLLEGKYPYWADLLRARFARTLPECAQRIVFLPQLAPDDFVNLLAVADVVLDTPHFNGMNTSLEAFAMGTPIVTLPGAHQRGRHTAGMYRRMGVADGVAADAADYVRIAVRLGTDRAARESLRARILERCGVLFEDPSAPLEFGRFFETAVAAARENAERAPAAAAAPDAGAGADEEFRRGNAQLEAGRYADAEAACERVLALDPRHAGALSNLGVVRNYQERAEEALACFQRAVELDGTRAAYRNNLAHAQITLRRLEEAGATLERTLALEPENADARWIRATLLLLRGDYARGWREYEWRWISDRRARQAAGRFPQPRWRGEAAAGKTVLVHTEQGLGDAIQFIRYARLVAERGLTVVLETRPALQRLLASAAGVARIAQEGTPGRVDYHCPLMSLPLVFGTTLQSVPAAVPYLRADPARVAHWRTRLPADGTIDRGPRVGLVWSSDPRQAAPGADAFGKRAKSCPAGLLAPLARVSGVRFVSLQKDLPAGEAPPPLPMADFMAQVDDLADTAAIIESLDLVISVDTAVAHLAGALGKPVWVLLVHDSEWRWLLERADSPWYPTARLFRQPRRGDWAAVVAGVAAALEAL